MTDAVLTAWINGFVDLLSVFLVCVTAMYCMTIAIDSNKGIFSKKKD